MHKKGIIICVAALAAVLVVGGIFLLAFKPSTVTEKTEKLFEGPTVCEMKFEGNDGIVTLEVYPNLAPKTADRFLSLVKKGFYDDMPIHRIVEDMIIQTGDGNYDKKLTGEFADNGHINPLEHTRGVLSMARASDYDSATSQFFIVTAQSISTLDGQYAAFGKVTEGMEVIDRIADTPCDGETPITSPVIEYIRLK